MATTGQVLHAPTGMTLRLVRTGADTGGELLEMEATYPATEWLPPEHLHPRQAERFTVLDGEMRTIVAGIERVYGAGEAFDVPAGEPHQMTAPTGARVRWLVRPALRTAEFFEHLYAGPADGEDGAIWLRELLAEHADEIQMT